MRPVPAVPTPIEFAYVGGYSIMLTYSDRDKSWPICFIIPDDHINCVDIILIWSSGIIRSELIHEDNTLVLSLVYRSVTEISHGAFTWNSRILYRNHEFLHFYKIPWDSHIKYGNTTVFTRILSRCSVVLSINCRSTGYEVSYHSTTEKW